MSNGTCETPPTDCPLAETLRGCYSDVHHLYYPRKTYRTKIEKEFRELPENKVRLCRAAHQAIHAEMRAPEKPSRDMMLAVISQAEDRCA